MNWGIMDGGIMRELALQISGIGKIVHTGTNRRQGAVESDRIPEQPPQAEPAVR
jgi:hypothetical protein